MATCTRCHDNRVIRVQGKWVRCPKCSPLHTQALRDLPKLKDSGPDAYPQYPVGDPRRTFGF